MFLVARLVGLLLYVVLLGSMYYLIKRCYLNRDIKFLLFLYWILIGVMSFNYSPIPSSDLSRLWPIMHSYAQMNFQELLESITNSPSTTPGVAVYYFLIGKLGNDGWLPAITALIIYGIVFLVLYDCYKNKNISRTSLAASMLVFMSRGLLNIMIGNIRTGLAIALVFWCVYQEMENGKSIIKSIPFYLCAILLHTMGQILVIIRLGYRLIESSRNGKYKIVKLLGASALFGGMIFLGIRYGFVDGLTNKTNSYIVKYQTNSGFFYIWEFLINLFFIGLYLYILRRNNCAVKQYTTNGEPKKQSTISTFFAFIVITDIVLMFVEYNLYYRMGWFSAFLAIPVTCEVLSRYEDSPLYYNILKTIIIVSTLLLFIECARGDLCSLKFW